MPTCFLFFMEELLLATRFPLSPSFRLVACTSNPIHHKQAVDGAFSVHFCPYLAKYNNALPASAFRCGYGVLWTDANLAIKRGQVRVTTRVWIKTWLHTPSQASAYVVDGLYQGQLVQQTPRKPTHNIEPKTLKLQMPQKKPQPRL